MRSRDPIRVMARRGSCLESEHRIDVAVADGRGLLAEFGDAEREVLFRSAAKPFLGLELARRTSALDPPELAIACASHDGGEAAVGAAEALLARAEMSADDLRCRQDHQITHPCSGCHAGLALLARLIDAPLEGYNLADHPVQRDWLAGIGDAIGRDWTSLELAGDGCCLPTAQMTLAEAASAYSRLASDADEARAVREAMLRHPGLVGAEDFPDVLVMRRGDGVVAKVAAGGLLCIALPSGVGIALKCIDSSFAPLGPAAFELLGLGEDRNFSLFDDCGNTVGEMRADPVRSPLR